MKNGDLESWYITCAYVESDLFCFSDVERTLHRCPYYNRWLCESVFYWHVVAGGGENHRFQSRMTMNRVQFTCGVYSLSSRSSHLTNVTYLGQNRKNNCPTLAGDDFYGVRGTLVILTGTHDACYLVVVHGAFCVDDWTRQLTRCTRGKLSHLRAVRCQLSVTAVRASRRGEVMPNEVRQTLCVVIYSGQLQRHSASSGS